jgi:hypothetical protein
MSDVFATTSSPFGLTSDGTYLYTTNNSLNTISRFNFSTKVENTDDGFPLTSDFFNNPLGLCYHNSCLYIANFTDENIIKYDIALHEVTIFIAKVSKPYDIVYYPAGDALLVCDQNKALIHMYDLTGGQIFQTPPGSYLPKGMTVVGDKLYVGSGADDYYIDGDPTSIMVYLLNSPDPIGYSTSIPASSWTDNIFALAMGSSYLYAILNNSIALVDVSAKEITSTITTMNLNHPRGLCYKSPYLYISDNFNNNIRMLDTTKVADLAFSSSLLKNTYTCAVPVLNHRYNLSLETLNARIVQFLKTKDRIMSIPLVDPSTQSPVGDFIVSLNVVPSSISNHLSVSGTGSFVFMKDNIRAQIHFFHTIPTNFLTRERKRIALMFPELVKRDKGAFKKATDSYGIKYNSVELDTSKIPNHAVFVCIKPTPGSVAISLYLTAYNTSDSTLVASQSLLSELPSDSVYSTILQNLTV